MSYNSPAATAARTGRTRERRGRLRVPPLHPFTLLLLTVSTLLGLPGPMEAQRPDTLRQDTVYHIEPIAVRAVRPTTTTGGVSAITVRLDSVRFRPAPLLEHVLRELPLVQVRRNSRGEAQLALRGAEERQIAILLDGIPLTLGWDHRTDLSVIPLTAAQRIELVRGMSSVLYGPNVLGGVVDIAMGSVPVARPAPLTLAAGVDQTGGYSLSALSGGAVEAGGGRVVVRGGLGRRAHDGFPTPDGLDALYPALATGDVRVNSDLEHTDGFFSARYARSGGAWVSASASAFTASRGVPPELHDDSPRLWRYPENDRAVAVVSGGLPGLENPWGIAKLGLNLGIDASSVRIEDHAMPALPASPATTDDAFFRTVVETEEAEGLTLTARFTGEQTLPGGAVVSAAATWADVRHDEVVTVDLNTPSPAASPAEYRQRLWSVGAEVELPFQIGLGEMNGGRLSAGLVYDGADTPETGGDVEGRTMTDWGGRLGVSTASRGGGLVVHAAVSRRGRFPALREMYSTALGRFHPNPDLEPEVLTVLEAGFTGRFDGYDVQVVGFHQRLDDAIARGAPPSGSTARFQRVNRNEIRSTGLEVLAGYTLGRLALETEFTLQDVEAISPGDAAVRAEYEPELAGGIGGTLPLFAGIEAGAEVEYWSEQFCSTPEPGQEDYVTLEPSTRADVQVARTFRVPDVAGLFQRLGLELAVDNVADSAVYDQCGLPQPGRTFRVQLRLQ